MNRVYLLPQDSIKETLSTATRNVCWTVAFREKSFRIFTSFPYRQEEVH